jgi:predicted DNA-binding antitoxin AbrB/MazE fold protein
MAISIRAVYEQGRLRPLEPVTLAEGQEIQLMILTDRERSILALGDLLVEVPPPPDDDSIDEEALMREVEEGLRGKPSLSKLIIEERREGP